MNIQISTTTALPALIDRAASALVNARSAAEVLEAREMASAIYDAAKKAARLGKAKKAHDDLISAVFRTQADALEIEAGAKRRLADEYDAAQERGEARTRGGNDKVTKIPDGKFGPKDIGLDDKQLHEARIIRDAEVCEPGIVHRVVSEALAAGEEPTRAKVTKAVKAKRTRGRRFEAPQETQHDRDLRALLGVWESSCESARKEFLETVN
jgi:hypothetical protein